jgi:hypothetical protein
MRLIKKGVVVETIRPTEILNYKRKGYVEVKEGDKPPEESKALKDMTLVELKEEAKARGLSGYSTLAKDELLALLQGEQDEQAGE